MKQKLAIAISALLLATFFTTAEFSLAASSRSADDETAARELHFRDQLTEQQEEEIAAKKAEIEKIRQKLGALTQEQKAALAKIQSEIFTLQKELITKYVHYGVMTQEQGDRILKRLERIEGQNGWMQRRESKKGNLSSSTSSAS